MAKRRPNYRLFKVIGKIIPNGLISIDKSIATNSFVNKFNNSFLNKFNNTFVSKPDEPPNDTNWILNDGIWNDDGIWLDDEVWYDS